MIIYTCPKCGSDIYHTCIFTLPPIDVWACLDCDWKYEEKDGVEYRPFKPVKAKLDEDWTTYENIENVMLND